MKGLFVKDLRLLKEFKTFLFVILFIVVCFNFQELKLESLSFVVFYIAIMCAMIPNNMIAYDQENQGMAFLMTLPVTAKQYVYEKYAFSIGFIFLGSGVGCLVTGIVAVVRGTDIPVVAFLSIAGVALMFSMIMMSVLLPIRIKFAEKATVMTFGVVFVIVGGAYLVTFILKKMGVSLTQAANFFNSNFVVLIVATVIFTFIILAVSMMISTRIIKHMEY